MKFILRQYTACLISLFIASHIFTGLRVSGSMLDFLYAAGILVVGFLFIKPIINIITLPLAILTLGLFSTIGTIFVMFILTKIDPNIVISEFFFKGFALFGYTIPSFKANLLLSYVLISVTIQLVYKIMLYLFDL